MSWNAAVVAVGKKEAIRSVASLGVILVVSKARSSSSSGKASKAITPAASRTGIRLHADPGV